MKGQQNLCFPFCGFFENVLAVDIKLKSIKNLAVTFLNKDVLEFSGINFYIYHE